eukprot:s421_g13.t1
MSKQLFLNRRLSVAMRLRLLEALVLPIVFYGSGSWPRLPARQYQRLSSVLTSWQRQVVGQDFWSAGNIPDDAFRAHWRIPSLAVRLAKHRLLFLLQLHRHGPQVVWDMLTAEDATCSSSWLDAVRHAFDWIATLDAILCHVRLGPARISWLGLSLLLPMLPPEFAVLCLGIWGKNIISLPCLELIAKSMTFALDMGAEFDAQSPSQDAMQASCFACQQCGREFSTIQGLTAHRWKQHGIISDERRFFSGTCERCRRCFWTAQRLQQHLRYSRRRADGCFWWLQKLFDPLPQSHWCTATDSLGLVDGSLLSVRWCEIVDEYQGRPDSCREQAVWAFAIWGRTCLYDVLESIDDLDISLYREIEEHYLQLLYDLPVVELIDLLDALQRAVPPASPQPDVPAAAGEVGDLRAPRPIESFSGAFDGADAYLQPVVGAPILYWPDVRGIPVCEFPDGKQVLLFVHLFSGLIAGSLSGLPCETWSAAWHLPPPDDHGAACWALATATSVCPATLGIALLALARDSAASRMLMLNNVKIELGIVLRGGASLLEHPALHDGDE